LLNDDGTGEEQEDATGYDFEEEADAAVADGDENVTDEAAGDSAENEEGEEELRSDALSGSQGMADQDAEEQEAGSESLSGSQGQGDQADDGLLNDDGTGEDRGDAAGNDFEGDADAAVADGDENVTDEAAGDSAENEEGEL
jgi:hypothetical protein